VSNRRQRRRAEPVDFPLCTRGVYKASGYSRIPEGFTPYARNVYPYDSFGRLRPGQRCGSGKFWSFQFGGGAKFIQHLSAAQVTDATAGTSYFKVIVGCGGMVYGQMPGDASATRLDGSGAATFSASRKITAFTINNVTYFTDGLVVKQYDWGAATFGDWTAAAGTFPVSNSQYPRIWCPWRGRAVWARFDKGIPSIMGFDAMGGAATNFDYGATPAPDIAIATNSNWKAGQIGEGVTALMPTSGDVLYVSQENKIGAFRGDPGDGGTYVEVSGSVGVLADRAFCEVEGTIYFWGTGGIYRLRPFSTPERISEAIHDDVSDMPHQGWYLEAAYDKKLDAILFTATQAATPFATKHYLYDMRAERAFGVGGWWPIDFPADTGGDDNASGTTAPTYGPTKILSFDGNAQTTDSRVVLLGGRDGYVRYMADSLVGADTGAAITSDAYLAFVRPAGATSEAMLNGWWPVLAEHGSAVNAEWSIRVGATPYVAHSSPAITKSGTFTSGGRQAVQGHRATGNSFALRIQNSTLNKQWALEQATGHFEPAGPVR